MNKKILRRYLRGNVRYTFKIDEYLFPKYLITSKNYVIDLERNRQSNLYQGSRWSPEFRRFLDTKYKYVRYIREFPIIIRKRKLWKSLCEKYQLDKDKQNRNYFLVDYFMPNFNLIVEIDSQLHNTEYDKARDEYIQTVFGLETLRFYEYGKDNYKTFENNFQFFIRYCKYINSTPIRFNYLGIVIIYYVMINYEILRIIDKIERYLRYNKRSAELRLNSFVISKEDIYHLSNNPNQFKEVCYYIRYQYNINVTMKP